MSYFQYKKDLEGRYATDVMKQDKQETCFSNTLFSNDGRNRRIMSIV